ncbi:MAG: hypothetical protein ACAI37_18600 [Chthoniobacter sp.]
MNATVPLPGSYYIGVQGVPDLVVTAVGGKTMLVWRNVNDPNQLWTVSKVQFSTNLYVFYNQGAPGGLNAPSYGDNITLSGVGSVWYVGGDLNGFNVIRLAENDGFNLNALGGWPADVATPVGVWNWSGGAPNEQWQVISSDTFPNPAPHNWVQVGVVNSISAVADDHAANFAPVSMGTRGLDERTIFDKIDSPGHGFALRSRYHGRFLHYNGPNQPLGWASPMSLRCLWTSAPLSSQGLAIRPFLDDTQDITFVGGDNPGTPINTGDWRGGQDGQWLHILDVNAELAAAGR